MADEPVADDPFREPALAALDHCVEISLVRQ
jgi:hypothetical protein